MADTEETDFQALVTRALAGVDNADLRIIIAKAVRQQLSQYDCKQAFERVVNPLVHEIVRAALQEPDVQRMLQDRVRSEVVRLMGNLTVTAGRSGY